MKLGQDKLILEELNTQAHQIPNLPVKTNQISMISRPFGPNNTRLTSTEQLHSLVSQEHFPRRESADNISRFTVPQNLGYQPSPDNRHSVGDSRAMRLQRLTIDLPDHLELPTALSKNSAIIPASVVPKFNEIGNSFLKKDHRNQTSGTGSYSILPENNKDASNPLMFRPSIRNEESASAYVQPPKSEADFQFSIYRLENYEHPDKLAQVVSSKNILSRDASLDLARTQGRPTVRDISMSQNFVTNHPTPATQHYMGNGFVTNFHGVAHQTGDKPHPGMHRRTPSEVLLPTHEHQQSFTLKEEDRRLLREPIAPFKLLPLRSQTQTDPPTPGFPQKPYPPLQNIITDIYYSDSTKTWQDPSPIFTEKSSIQASSIQSTPRIFHSRSLYNTFQQRSATQGNYFTNQQAMEMTGKNSRLYSPLTTGLSSPSRNLGQIYPAVNELLGTIEGSRPTHSSNWFQGPSHLVPADRQSHSNHPTFPDQARNPLSPGGSPKGNNLVSSYLANQQERPSSSNRFITNF